MKKSNILPHELHVYAEMRVEHLTILALKFALPREGVKTPS